jgi:hypothetical protein
MLSTLKSILGRRFDVSDSVRTHLQPAQSQYNSPVFSNRQKWRYRTARDHAEALLAHARDKLPDHGLLLFDEIIELYLDMLHDQGWAPRSWNPVAHELDLICTGGAKPYAWVIIRGGKKVRRRVYPIPRRREGLMGGNGVPQTRIHGDTNVATVAKHSGRK